MVNRASADLKIPVVCLDIIRLLWTRLRSFLKMQIEALINGIFGHTLHWTLANLDVNNPSFPRGDDANSFPSAPSPSNASLQSPRALAVEAAFEEFTSQMISMQRLFSTSFEILDCLVDLLGEETLLPDLYVNYDCDGNRSDLTQNTFELLAQVVQQSHVACTESHDETHFAWAQAIGDLALRGIFNALYVVYLRTQRLQPQIGSGLPGNESSSTPSEDDIHDDNLIDENGGVSPSSTGSKSYISADVLFKKRQRKKFFQHGIQEFNRKPLAGVKYLQQHSFLPTPLDSMSLATFLRSLPQGLRKDAVGIYLGAMGKEVKEFEKTEIHEADTMDFHRDVLADFVQSFNFEGESIVAALRMFLASFRLPGEAQQIDRILNAFSLQVYEQSRDRFLMASVDVAYLLSFSLIMLNTDLHNPNIRPEKKMNLDDFIKNNKNYGPEVSHNQDLPNDFLTGLYNTIAKDEIKTFEDGGKHGEVTSDRWKDLLNQAESDPRNSRLIVHGSYSAFTNTSGKDSNPSSRPGTAGKSAQQSGSSNARIQETAELSSPGRYSTSGRQSSSVAAAAAALLLPPRHVPLASEQYDRHIFELVQGQLVRAFASVFQQFVDASKASDLKGDVSSSSRRDVAGQKEVYVPQKTTLQLACNGFVLGAAVASHLTLTDHCNTMFVRLCKYTALLSSDVYPLGYNERTNGMWLFCSNQSAPIATAAVLKLVSTCSLSLLSRSWKYFFRVVSGLREFRALPQRVLFPSDGTAELLSAEERREFFDLVYRNKEDLERKIALSARSSDSEDTGSGGFFSGVAWLLSALDSNLGGSAMSSSLAAASSQHKAPDYDLSSLSPVELALYTEDLVLEPKPPRKDTSGDVVNDDGSVFGSDAWIRTTLAPYRLEFLLEDINSLPCRALGEIMEALHSDILEALRGAEKQTPREQKPSDSRRTGSAPSTLNEHPRSTKKRLSQGACVLFEHLLSQIVASSPSLLAGGADDDDGIAVILEAHYLQILELLRPILATNVSVSGLTYENAAILLQKSINGLFAWVSRSQNDAGGALLMNFLSVLMELGDNTNGDDSVGDDSQTILRPFVTQLVGGLSRYVELIEPERLRFSRMDWLTVGCLISWSVSARHAASHGFALLERLVTGQMWNIDGNEILVTDCYTKMLMFAAKPRSPCDSWSSGRPLELLVLMFDTLRPETPNYKEERLRFIGGLTLVCRDLLRLQDLDQESSFSWNELVVAAFDAVKHMVRSHCSGADKTMSFRGSAWLDVLRFGLVPIGFDLLLLAKTTSSGRGSNKSLLSALGTEQLFNDNEEEMNASFLYYRRQLPPPVEVADPRDGRRSPTGAPVRRRRPSSVKDPLVLRPYVIFAQLLSLVVCEELHQLVACPKFTVVWDDIVTLLLGLLEHTEDPHTSGSETAPMIAALERRSVLSAHEEILEHGKAIARRVATLKDTSPQSDEAASAESTSFAGALTRVLEEKCRDHPGVFELLIPTSEDALTPTSDGVEAPIEVDAEEKDSEGVPFEQALTASDEDGNIHEVGDGE